MDFASEDWSHEEGSNCKMCCVRRRGRKPGSGRKNGGAGAKGKDKKLSGTESEQEVSLGNELTSC